MTPLRTAIIVSLCVLLALACIFALVSPAQGQTIAPRSPDRIQRVSLAAAAIGSGLDFASSVGRVELNPVLRGTDGRFSPSRGAVVKAAPLVALGYVQSKTPWKGWRYVNFAAAGVFTGVAVRNWRGKR